MSQFPSPNPKSCFAGVVKKSFNAIGIAVDRPISFSEEYDSEVINSQILSKLILPFCPKRIGRIEAIRDPTMVKISKRKNFFQENFVRIEHRNKRIMKRMKKNFNSAKAAINRANPHFKKQDTGTSVSFIKASRDFEMIIEKKISV